MLLSSLVNSVQYLVCQRGTQVIPTAAAAYVIAFYCLQKKAETVKKLSKTQVIRMQYLPLDSDYLDNTGTKNRKEAEEEKGTCATKCIKALCNQLKLLFKKTYISITSCSAAKVLRKCHYVMRFML